MLLKTLVGSVRLGALIALAGLAACKYVPANAAEGGVPDGGVPDGGTTTGNCANVSVGSFAPGEAQGWLTAPATPSPDSGSALFVNVELDENAGYHQAPGSFDLSQEQNYGTCNHCVLGLVGATDEASASRVFFQATGTLDLNDVSSPPTSESKGSLQDVTLREATIDPTSYAVTFVPGGQCLHIASASWDTRVALGAPCTSASDCGDTTTKGCDPSTAQCVALNCDGAQKTCGTGRTCVAETANATAGVCAAQCKPGGTPGCPSGSQCVPINLANTSWICEKQGNGAQGQPCTSGIGDTGCGPGLLCGSDNGQDVCRTICNVFSATPGCPAGQQCELGGACTTEAADPAAIGAACSASAGDYTPCASDGKAYRGECVPGSGKLTCRALCRFSDPNGCPVGQTCQLTLHDSVGACE